MAAVGDEKKRLMQTGVFRTQNDVVTYLLARMIGKSESPVGAWTLKEELEQSGINYGTATVGRYLKELDSRGMTEQRSNQGRILTEDGKKWLAKVSGNVARAQMHNESSKALRVNKYSDLVDLIQARKAIEVEAVRLAVANATAQEVEALKKSVLIHYRYVAENRDPTEPALDFHMVVADMSHNRFIKAMLDMLFFEERQIENNMEQLVTRERGDAYVVEHDDTTNAIEARDGELAVQLMERHIDALLSAVREQIEKMAEEDEPENAGA